MFNGKSTAAIEGVKTIIYPRSLSLCAQQGIQTTDLCIATSLCSTWSQLSLSSYHPCSLVSFFFSFSHAHTQVHVPINEYFKRLHCCSYWFLCFGCGALRDFKKIKNQLCFYQSFPHSACLSEVCKVRTRKRIHTGKRNKSPSLHESRTKIKQKSSHKGCSPFFL